ncbi:MAG: TetR/AcrR family transcriptional regulator [Myxococcaceae bacterium]|jgi:AcrR family transcriptional regulator|nr:TetR/AcrR family transcriptional regulator [Myxococcaceae bacterium]
MGKGEQTRQLIVDRALTMAQRIGLEQVTLGVLADELDLSKSGLFAHFKSKEQLQLEVVAEAVARFTSTVILPALKAPRGLPRVQQLFEGYLRWIDSASGSSAHTGGCILMAFSYEYDDRPGPVHDAIQKAMQDWLDCIARVAKTAVDAGELAAGLDVKQFAFEFDGLLMAFHHAFKLHRNPRAEPMARKALAHLLERSTPTR